VKISDKYAKIILNLFLTVGGIFLLAYVIPKTAMYFLPLVIGWCIAILANPLVRYLEKKLHIVRKQSSALVIVAAIAVVILVLYLLVSRLGIELLDFIRSFPELYANIEQEAAQLADDAGELFSGFPAGVRLTMTSLLMEVDQHLEDIASKISEPTVSAVSAVAKKIPKFLMGMVFTILSAYFFVADRERIMKFFQENTPTPVLEMSRDVIRIFKVAVGGYFVAQFKIMGVVFAILLIGFLILGVRYSVLLAFIFSLLDFLPFFGTAITLLPWALYKLLVRNYTFAIGLVIIYVVSQTVRQMIQPKVVGDTVGMSPTATLVYIFIGYKVKGVIGMLLAVPIGVILTNLYKKGAFDRLISDFSVIVDDINHFRKN